MSKLISFSLWGDNPKYTIGALKNAALASKIYPGWQTRFYVGDGVPHHITNILELHGAEVVIKNGCDWRGLFWRFEPLSENFEAVICRDCDSRLNTREASIVNDWLERKEKIYISRDHPHHRFYVLGGMWGAKRDAIPDMKCLIDEYLINTKSCSYGSDYAFFETIKPIIEISVVKYDEFFGGHSVPTPREGLQFVGQVFDENDNSVKEHQEILRRWLEK